MRRTPQSTCGSRVRNKPVTRTTDRLCLPRTTPSLLVCRVVPTSVHQHHDNAAVGHQQSVALRLDVLELAAVPARPASAQPSPASPGLACARVFSGGISCQYGSRASPKSRQQQQQAAAEFRRSRHAVSAGPSRHTLQLSSRRACSSRENFCARTCGPAASPRALQPKLRTDPGLRHRPRPPTTPRPCLRRPRPPSQSRSPS